MKTVQACLRLLAFVLFSFHTFAEAKVEAVIGQLAIPTNANLPTGLPETDASEIIISRFQYVISYNKERRAPNWVAWSLDNQNLGSASRTNIFYQDAELEKYLTSTTPDLHAVKPSEYNGSCYDRGHQIPSADRTDTPENNQATFLMSNMLPQTAYLNRIIWANLENYTRKVAKDGKKIFVIAGPIYDQDYGMIGPQNDIAVPSKNFKIIAIFAPGSKVPEQTISVIMPNTLEDGSLPSAGRCTTGETVRGASAMNAWMNYVVDVKDIERLSGIRFPLLSM